MYTLNTKQKPTSSSIPYDKLDKEMIELLKLLNEKGFKTRFCCWGHKPFSSAFIMFDTSIIEQQMAELLYHLTSFNYKAYKWMRYCEPINDVWNNWILEYPAHNVPKDEEKYDEVKRECHNKLINILREM